jgi:hypothetical protein
MEKGYNEFMAWIKRIYIVGVRQRERSCVIMALVW